MHRNANHEYLFGPSRLGGMEVPSFAVTTNAHRLTMLMDHLERDDATKKLFWASLGYAQLAVGSGRQLLSLTYNGYSYLVP